MIGHIQYGLMISPNTLQRHWCGFIQSLEKAHSPNEEIFSSSDKNPVTEAVMPASSTSAIVYKLPFVSAKPCRSYRHFLLKGSRLVWSHFKQLKINWMRGFQDGSAGLRLEISAIQLLCKVNQMIIDLMIQHSYQWVLFLNLFTA